jgi:mRNA interferase RelE/StbE
MDKIAKLLKKLSTKEREHLEKTLTLLLSGNTKSLDIKKLKGIEEIYRVRVGSLRIIFQKNGSEIRILEISRKSEHTYDRQ